MRFGNLPWLSIVIGSLCIAFLVHTAQYRIETIHRKRDIFSSPPLSQLDTNFIKILTLGHKHVYDDFINIWLLQTLVERNKPNEPERMMNAIRSVIRHQPKLETLYMLSCFVMIQDFQRPDNCQEIILEGIKVFPKSWRLPIQQGYVHAFLTSSPAQAARFFMLAASREGAPSWLPGVVERLLSAENITEEDLQRSLQIMEHHSDHDHFINMIKRLRNFAPPSQTMRILE